jgi:H/ACA ribonucleoprotein complex subunit 4
MNAEIIIKRKADTSPKYGSSPYTRSVEELLQYSIINLNKPKGPTSHQVSYYVQKVMNIAKAGHSGTLDPGVTGVLPIAIGRGTRIVQALLPSGKEYVCIMHIHKPVDEVQIRKIMLDFIGRMKQLPPVKSAVKREWRFRQIYELEIYEIDGQDVLFRVKCEAGTYIRKLCHDIGLKLGVGAHMAELIRTHVGPFSYKDMVTIQDLRDGLWFYTHEKNENHIRNILLPIERALEFVPKVWILDSTVDAICHGSLLKVPGIAKFHSGITVDEMVAIMTLKEEVVALGTAKMTSDDMRGAERGIAVKIDAVFMKPNTYPRMEHV